MRCAVKEKENSAMSTYMITHLSTIDELHFPKNAIGAWIYQGRENLRAVAKILSYVLKQVKEFNTDNKIKKTF